MTNDAHGEDALRELYETMLDYPGDGDVPLRLVERLATVATRCGWDGEENAITWSARHVAVYRGAIVN